MIYSKFSGQISVICGSMFSGKTEELLRRIRRAQIANLKCLVIKPEIDNRYKSEKVVSHAKNEIGSLSIKLDDSILKHAKDYDVIAIDEAQFFEPHLVSEITELCAAGKRMIVVGLDMDSDGKPFGIMPHLMAIADEVLKLHAICTECGSRAQFSYRKSDNKAQVNIGGKEAYTALCRYHYQLAKSK